jgi:hypothetical protein
MDAAVHGDEVRVAATRPADRQRKAGGDGAHRGRTAVTNQAMRKGAFLEWGLCPQTPGIYRLWARIAVSVWTTMEALERRIGLRRNATRAPTQAPEWRGRLRPPRISNQTRRSITYWS